MRRTGSYSLPPPSERDPEPLADTFPLSDDEQATSRTATQLCHTVEQRIIDDINRTDTEPPPRRRPLRERSNRANGTNLWSGGKPSLLTEADSRRRTPGHTNSEKPLDTAGEGSFGFCLSGESLKWKGHEKLASELLAADRVDRVLPNLRDLAVSSCHEGIKAGLLYRSARLFSSALCEVSDVLLKILQIQLVLDLRDENLTAIQEELNSRLVMSRFYRPHLVTSARDRDSLSTDANDHPFVADRRSPPQTPNRIKTHVRNIRAQALTEAQIAHATINKPSRYELLKRMTHQANQLRRARPELPEELVRSLAVDPASHALCRMFARTEDRKMAIVNILE